MTITAKFSSICPCCNNRIEAGTKVEWTKGNKARHVACATQSGATSAPTREPLCFSGEPAIRAQHWSQRGHGPAVRLCAGGCGRRVGSKYAECYSCHQESIDAM